jgi:bifunctional DNA-binding transcriptional regulator/antitoxin component of YhaV-PrlF toxin-antitoxin module
MNLTESANTSMKTFSLQVQKEGQISIPQDVLNTLQTHEGQTLTLLQIGEFAIIVPRIPQVTTLTESFVALMNSSNVTVDELLEGLQEERQAIWQEQQKNKISA